MTRIFIGYDKRQPVAFQVLAHSIWKYATRPLSITRLVIERMPVKRRGLTEFTFSRYLVPWLCGYEGSAIFMDADMLVLGDICELEAICDPQSKPLCVSKNKLRFEWPSLMHFNNALCKALTPQLVETGDPHSLAWAEGEIGEIPATWNHLVGYDRVSSTPKCIHYTKGIPCWPETEKCEFSKQWNEHASESFGTVSWQELMGGSVHAPKSSGR